MTDSLFPERSSVSFAAQAVQCPHVLYSTVHCARRRWPAVLQKMSVCTPSCAVLKTKEALDLLVMTGMGFDAQGHRLGRGGG